jgi:branched-chain amino acid transport system ATP-binding protein
MHDFFRVEQLVIRYGPIAAVQEVSLDVAEGEIVALLGANGAGKSSLLKGVVGLVRPTAGGVIFRGEEIQRFTPEEIVRRGLTLTPEGRRVFPRLSVQDNLRLGAAVQRDRTASREAYDRVFQLFPMLRDRLSSPAGILSGGQQGMLAIARSLMASPALLLLDEPSLGLAPIVVDQIFELLERLRQEGTTILLVEQNVYRTLAIADRGFVLASGRLEDQGPAGELRLSAEVERAYLGIG